LASHTGEPVVVGDLDVIWWRRAHTPPRVPATVTDEAHRQLIANDSQAAVLGLLLTEFAGTWVSDPAATRRAENKLVQLHAAQAAGFRVPKTLVSQDPDAVARFCRTLDNQVVVKPVRGTRIRPPLTGLLDDRLLAEEAATAVSLSPAIYQEYVPGRHHVRVHVFGDQVYAAELESDAVDWRADMNIPVRPTELPAAVEDRLRHVLRLLDLRMGVFDLKRADGGEFVWLEVNPQGQFLFIEGLCGLPLTSALGDFLMDEARRAARRR
jgi:glutathione synthase/RimK-type ligase-like ATP-grasp enzyme